MFFPHPLSSTDEGLLAIGGDLSIERLRLAYSYGIFPWYNQSPILWWFTFPRAVIYPEQVYISKTMRKLLQKNTSWKVTINQAFEEVMDRCAQINRRDQQGTWITIEMKEAYAEFHRCKKAHSLEIWENDELIGGLYGVVNGKIFYGESMFAHISNSSKFGFILFSKYLFSLGCSLIDCQQDTPHMRSLGAELLSKNQFWQTIKKNLLNEDLPIDDQSFQQWLSTRD